MINIIGFISLLTGVGLLITTASYIVANKRYNKIKRSYAYKISIYYLYILSILCAITGIYLMAGGR